MGAVVPRKGRDWKQGRIELRWLGSSIGALDAFCVAGDPDDRAEYDVLVDGQVVSGMALQFVQDVRTEPGPLKEGLVWQATLPSETEGQDDLEVVVREDGRPYRNARQLMRGIQKAVDGGWQPDYHGAGSGDPDAPVAWWDGWEEYFVERGTASDRVRRAREARA